MSFGLGVEDGGRVILVVENLDHESEAESGTNEFGQPETEVRDVSDEEKRDQEMRSSVLATESSTRYVAFHNPVLCAPLGNPPSC